jgi:signal transduction histidine kinase
MHQMSDALRETREQESADAVARDEQDTVVEMPVEDRRGTTPFMKELSLDAKKSVAKINGITQLLKHKKDQKDQAQLIKQLTGHARRLDNLVADIADAERLASGSIKLNIRRTDMESLVNRVVEEAMADSDHDIRVVAEPAKVRIDQVRTEQILNGLLRASSERTQSGKTIVVRLQRAEGGALLSVEDPEPSSDASISPVVRRLAEAHGGTVKAESRDGGGSAFRVFLPDPEVQTDGAAAPDVKILVDEAGGQPQDEPWEAEAAHQQLAAELRRHAELQTDS